MICIDLNFLVIILKHWNLSVINPKTFFVNKAAHKVVDAVSTRCSNYLCKVQFELNALKYRFAFKMIERFAFLSRAIERYLQTDIKYKLSALKITNVNPIKISQEIRFQNDGFILICLSYTGVNSNTIFELSSA